MQNCKGFTLLEMMVVLSVCLMLMVLVVPIFQAVTRSIQLVERKLSVYESARNILDIMESELRQMAVNERGGHFSLKRIAWEDQDAFTPSGMKPFAESRRQADCVQYLVRQPGAIAGDYGKPLFPGSQAFPLAYPENYAAHLPEAWKVSLRSTLAYQTPADELEYESRPGRLNQLYDVSLIESSMIFIAIGSEWNRSKKADGYHGRLGDEISNTAAPGNEIRVPPAFDENLANSNNPSRQLQRRIDGIYLMDLDLSYWSEGTKSFEYLPDSTVVYFSRPPKAVCVRITVCDREKRSRVTLSRIIHLPIGLGDGHVEDSRDSFLEDSSANVSNDFDYKVFDRTKKLCALEPMQFGNPLPLNWP